MFTPSQRKTKMKNLFFETLTFELYKNKNDLLVWIIINLKALKQLRLGI